MLLPLGWRRIAADDGSEPKLLICAERNNRHDWREAEVRRRATRILADLPEQTFDSASISAQKDLLPF